MSLPTGQQMAFETIEQVHARGGHPWHPPTLADFAYGEVLAFDQTITSTGAVIISHDREHGLRLGETRMIRPHTTTLTSHEGNYARTSSVEDGMTKMAVAFLASGLCDRYVVGERPLIGDGKRGDSSLLTGYAAWRATRGRLTLVHNRHAKVVLVGRAGTKDDPVTKAHIKQVIERYLPRPATGPWNEHVRDAAMLALVHLFDLKQKDDKAA